MDPVIEDYVDHFEIGFEQFKLKPGLELEVHDDAGKTLLHKAQFVMTHPGNDVLIALRLGDARRLTLEPGARYRVSGFTGKFDFAFHTAVRTVDRAQCTAMLAAPASAIIRFVRKDPRTDLMLPGTIASRRNGGSGPVTIRNLSVGGAALSSVQPLGARGEPLVLQFHVTFENRRELLRLAAVVRRSGAARDSLMYETGVEFVNPSRMEKLLLHYYISTLANEYAVI